MPGLCYHYVFPDLNTYLESRGYRTHVSEEWNGCWVEERVYKARAGVSKRHARSHDLQLLFSLVSAMWIQSPERQWRLSHTTHFPSVSSKFWVLSLSEVVLIPNCLKPRYVPEIFEENQLYSRLQVFLLPRDFAELKAVQLLLCMKQERGSHPGKTHSAIKW